MRQACGTYVLILKLSKGQRIQIGRLRRVRFQPGFYAYVGSALGHGGLRARVGRHMSSPKRSHWHIDFLRPRTRLVEVWYSYGRRRREHDWARCLSRMQGSSTPVAGFGSSDCDCFSHLIRFDDRPSRRSFYRMVRALEGHRPMLLSEDGGSRA